MPFAVLLGVLPAIGDHLEHKGDASLYARVIAPLLRGKSFLRSSLIAELFPKTLWSLMMMRWTFSSSSSSYDSISKLKICQKGDYKVIHNNGNKIIFSSFNRVNQRIKVYFYKNIKNIVRLMCTKEGVHELNH